MPGVDGLHHGRPTAPLGRVRAEIDGEAPGGKLLLFEAHHPAAGRRKLRELRLQISLLQLRQGVLPDDENAGFRIAQARQVLDAGVGDL